MGEEPSQKCEVTKKRGRKWRKNPAKNVKSPKRGVGNGGRILPNSRGGLKLGSEAPEKPLKNPGKIETKLKGPSQEVKINIIVKTTEML